MDFSGLSNFRREGHEAPRPVPYSNTANSHSPPRKVLPVQVQKFLQSSLCAPSASSKELPALHELDRRYSTLVNRIANLFEDICSNDEISEEKMIHLQDIRSNLHYLQGELNQLDLPKMHEAHARQQIEKAETLLDETLVLARYMPEYSAKISAFDDAIETFTEKIYEPYQAAAPLLAITDVKEAVERLDDVWQTVQDVKEHPAVGEKMTALFAEDLRNFSWQIEDWVEAVEQSVDQERKVLARLAKGDQPEQAALQLQALDAQLRKIGAVVGELSSKLKDFSSPENKDSIRDLTSALKDMQKLSHTASKGPVNKNNIEYGGEQWLKLVDQRPKEQVGWLKTLFQNVTQSENWSDTTKRIVHSVFIGMQLSEQAIGFTNKLHSVSKEADSLHREALNHIPKEQMEQIDRETAALGTLLSSKFSTLKDSPQTLEKLTKRYPEIRSILQESLKAPQALSQKDIGTITDAYRLQRTLSVGSVPNPYAHLSLQEWWRLFTTKESSETVTIKASPLHLSDVPWNEPATAEKSSGIGSTVIDWIGRLWNNPHEAEEQVSASQKLLKEEIVKTQKMNHQLVPEPSLDELRKEVALLHQELLRTIEHRPADMCPIVELDGWTKQVEEKCYAVQNLERRIEILMRATQGSLVVDDAELESHGVKHTNIVKQARLVEALGIPGIQVPIPHGVASDTIHAFLQKSAPEVFEHWTALGQLYSQHSGEGRFLEEPVAAQHLQAIDEAITKAFNAEGAFEALSLPPEFIAWLDNIKASESYLMVRSTGSEDSRQMANAGGNVSKAYVSPNQQALGEALGDVVKSYFGYGSLQNRINAKQNPFEQKLKLAVTSQELIGETIGGSKHISKIPVSLVLFTDEPLYSGGETFRVMRISASYGHGDGVVGNQGVATDTATLLISETHPDQLYVLYDNKKKTERLAPIQGPDGISLEKVTNPPELQNRPALSPEMLARLYHWGIVGEKFFNGEATDMEIVIKGDTIHPVQARPVNRLPLLPTYLDRRKLALASESPLKESLQSEMLVPGRAAAFSIAKKEEILVAPTLAEAERAFKEGLHRLVIVQQPEPANSHPVVNFSNLGMPCLFVRDSDAVQDLMGQISQDTPLVACMQTSSLHLWDSQKAKTEDFISSGFAVHPAKIAVSIPVPSPQKMPMRRQQVPQEIKDFLIAIRDAESKEAVLANLENIERHPWVKNIKEQKIPLQPSSKTIQGRMDTVDAFAGHLDAALTETKEAVKRQAEGERLKPLFHVKVLESLLMGNDQKYGSVNQFALPDIWPTIEETQQLVDYQAQLPYPSKFIDLLLMGNQTFTPEAQGDWRHFLLDLETHAEQKTLPIEQVQTFKRMLQAFDKADLLTEWLSFHFSPSQESYPNTLERLAHLTNEVSGEDLVFIEKQVNIKEELQSISDQIDLFADPKTFDKAWERLQQLVSPQEQEAFAQDMKNVSGMGKAMALKNMRSLVDLYDSSIKVMKASPEWTMEEKVPLFRTMLLPYFSLLKSWHNDIINPESVPVRFNWDVSTYLNKLEELVHADLVLDIKQLNPSRDFSVAAAVLGSMTDFDRHFPVTSEDKFTLIHQNLLAGIGLLIQESFSDTLVSNSSLPTSFKSSAQTIGAKYPQKTSFEVGSDEIALKYNVPLRQHSAGLTLGYRKEDGSLQLKIQFLGMSENRWLAFGKLAELFDDLKMIHLTKSSFLTNNELLITSSIENPEQLTILLDLFEKLGDASTGTYPISDLRYMQWSPEIQTRLSNSEKIDPYQVNEAIFQKLIEKLMLDIEKRVADPNVEVRTEAYQLLETAVSSGAGYEKADQLAEKGIADPDVRVRETAYRVYAALVNTGQAYETASQVVEKGIMDPSGQVRTNAYRLYTSLVNSGNALKAATQAAEKGLKDPDPNVRMAVYELYSSLVRKGQSYEMAVQAAALAIKEPEEYTRSLSESIYDALISKGKAYQEASHAIEQAFDDPSGLVKSRFSNLLQNLLYKGEGHEVATRIAEKGIASSSINERSNAYYLYARLVDSGHAHEAAIRTVEKALADPNEAGRTYHLIRALVNNGLGYKTALLTVRNELGKPELNNDVNGICKALVTKGQGYEEAIQCAEKGVAHSDSMVRYEAYSLLYSLVLKGQAYDTAALAVKRAAEDPYSRSDYMLNELSRALAERS